MKDLEGRLGSLKEAKASVDERLTAAEDEGGTLRAELQTLRSQLDERQTQLQEATDKVGVHSVVYTSIIAAHTGVYQASIQCTIMYYLPS